MAEGADVFFRRQWAKEMGSASALPILPMSKRLPAFREHYGNDLHFYEGDLQEYALVERIFQEFQPEAVVHFGECPSAPYSMMDRDHAVFVQTNNITTTFNILFAMRDIRPDTHLVNLGTMGESGIPNMDISEGFFEVDFRGRKEAISFTHCNAKVCLRFCVWPEI